MAKRARGTLRPGQRRPIQRRAAASATAAAAITPTVRPGGLTDAEASRAAELEAQIVAEERAAEDARRRTRDRSRERVAEGTRAPSALAEAEREEYAYVARDVRRIVSTAALLLVILAVLYIAIEVLGIFKVT